MQCHSCGTEVRAGQKFCMECGASLRGVADITGEVPIVTIAQPPVTADSPAADDATHPMATVLPPPPPPSGDDTVRLPILTGAAVATSAPARQTIEERRVIDTTTAPIPVTASTPTDEQPVWIAEPTGRPAGRERRAFRLRPLLVLAILATGAALVAILTSVVVIDPPVTGTTPAYVVNDFGTNNSVAGLLAAGVMLAGSLAWCFGFRWGAGLAGGAGAALAGWAALLVGIAEWHILMGESQPAPAGITRDVGYWSLLAAGALGVLVLLGSLVRARSDGRSGLDPWIAALGAVSFLIAAGGPLIPEGSADWSGNYSSESLGVELPTLFFVGRLVQLGLLALCGVVGLLLVRRYGLGLAVGSAVATGWLLVTAATEQTASPIGPAYENPGSLDLHPHAVTIVGFALVGFFTLVAVVMALLDADH